MNAVCKTATIAAEHHLVAVLHQHMAEVEGKSFGLVRFGEQARVGVRRARMGVI